MVSNRKNLNIVDSIDKDKQKIYKTNKKIRPTNTKSLSCFYSPLQNNEIYSLKLIIT